jgi:hypothetical protein
MFVCQRCGRTCDDHEANMVLENPADSYSPLLRVCNECAKKQAQASALFGLGMLAFLLLAFFSFFSFCRP